MGAVYGYSEHWPGHLKIGTPPLDGLLPHVNSSCVDRTIIPSDQFCLAVDATRKLTRVLNQSCPNLGRSKTVITMDMIGKIRHLIWMRLACLLPMMAAAEHWSRSASRSSLWRSHR